MPDDQTESPDALRTSDGIISCDANAICTDYGGKEHNEKGEYLLDFINDIRTYLLKIKDQIIPLCFLATRLGRGETQFHT